MTERILSVVAKRKLVLDHDWITFSYFNEHKSSFHFIITDLFSSYHLLFFVSMTIFKTSSSKSFNFGYHISPLSHCRLASFIGADEIMKLRRQKNEEVKSILKWKKQPASQWMWSYCVQWSNEIKNQKSFENSYSFLFYSWTNHFEYHIGNSTNFQL